MKKLLPLAAIGFCLSIIGCHRADAQDALGVYEFNFKRSLGSGEAARSSARPHRPGSPASGPVRQMIIRIAEEEGVPVRFADAIIRLESGYRCGARNGGAIGLGQVYRQTARSVGILGSLYDCETNLHASFRYLRRAIAIHGGGCKAASAYNRGIHAPSACTGYGRRVLALAGAST